MLLVPGLDKFRSIILLRKIDTGSGIITTAIAVASPVGRPFNIFVVTLTVVQYGVWSCHKLKVF